MIRTGSASKALVIGAEVFSRILDFNDRTTCVLFGDGAGAVVLEASDDARASWRASCMPMAGTSASCACRARVGRQGARRSAAEDGRPGGVQARRRRARRASRARCWRRPARREADIDWLIPHQANIRIMQSTAKKLKLPLDKLVVTVDEHGNTSAASIPLALDDAVRGGKVKRGDTVMLEGVGGGFTWGAVLLDYLSARRPQRPRMRSETQDNEIVRIRLSRARARRPSACSTPGATTRPCAQTLRRSLRRARRGRRPADPRRPEGSARPDHQHPAGDAGRRRRLLPRLAGRRRRRAGGASPGIRSASTRRWSPPAR